MRMIVGHSRTRPQLLKHDGNALGVPTTRARKRTLSVRTARLLREARILLCDRDPKWSRGVEQWLGMVGIRVVRTPARAPNCNAYAERFVRSVKEECLHRVVPLGERHLRRILHEYATHYHCERTTKDSPTS
jgi:transposase InsO family protein